MKEIDPTPPRLMVVAGESSGDQIAALALARLRESLPRLECFGVGGPALAAAGMRIVAPLERLAVMGLLDVVRRLPAIWLTWRRVLRELRARRPHVLLLVDAPGFNLPLARAARRHVPRQVYYISPKYWAWKAGRLSRVASLTDRQALIFPFEEEDYRRVGGQPVFVGHPVLDLVAGASGRIAARAALGLDPDELVLALLPGSRGGELRRHLPLLRDAVAMLADQPLLPLLQVPDRAEARELARAAGLPGRVKVVAGRFHEVLRAADLGLVASGTASLEAAALGLPHLVYYKLDGPAAWLARRLVKARWASPVNLAAGRELVPELLNEEARGVLMADWVLQRLRGGALREEGAALAASVERTLGGPGASQRVADLLREELRAGGAAC
jgi:lipid-A-disaccharide synthase